VPPMGPVLRAVHTGADCGRPSAPPVHTRARYRRPGRSGCCGAELRPRRRMRRDGAGLYAHAGKARPLRSRGRRGAEGHALHAQGWKHEDEDEVPSDEQDSDGSGVDPARLRSAPAARLTKGPRMRCGNVALGSALMADACSCCGPCARAYGHASRMHADAHARARALAPARLARASAGGSAQHDAGGASSARAGGRRR
jgi:hypothetical protein